MDMYGLFVLAWPSTNVYSLFFYTWFSCLDYICLAISMGRKNLLKLIPTEAPYSCDAITHTYNSFWIVPFSYEPCTLFPCVQFIKLLIVVFTFYVCVDNSKPK